MQIIKNQLCYLFIKRYTVRWGVIEETMNTVWFGGDSASAFE